MSFLVKGRGLVAGVTRFCDVTNAVDAFAGRPEESRLAQGVSGVLGSRTDIGAFLERGRKNGESAVVLVVPEGVPGVLGPRAD